MHEPMVLVKGDVIKFAPSTWNKEYHQHFVFLRIVKDATGLNYHELFSLDDGKIRNVYSLGVASHWEFVVKA
jgi:hypothetical protein